MTFTQLFTLHVESEIARKCLEEEGEEREQPDHLSEI